MLKFHDRRFKTVIYMNLKKKLFQAYNSKIFLTAAKKKKIPET